MRLSSQRISRRSLLAAGAGGLLLPTAGRAQGLGLGLGLDDLRKKSGGGSTPYVGPLDIQGASVVAYCSAFALSAAMRGQPLITIADGAGGATRAFDSDASTGLSPNAAIQAYSSTPFVEGLSDQSGNGADVSNTTGARQPSWQAALNATIPSLKFDFSAGNLLSTNSAVNFTSPDITIFAVLYMTTASEIAGAGWATSNGGMRIGTPFGSNAVNYMDDAAGVGAAWNGSDVGSLNTLAVIDWELVGSQAPYGGNIYFNGVLTDEDPNTVGSAGFSGLNRPFALGDDDSTNPGNYGGQLFLFIIYPMRIPSTRAAVRQNIADKCGITLP